MYHIKKQLIKLLKNKEKQEIYTKARDTFITNDALGKCIYIYNGRKWLKKNLRNRYFLHKKIGSLKGLNTKKISKYKTKRKKKGKKKK